MERRRLAVRQAQLEEEERLSGERRRARRGLDLAEVRALAWSFRPGRATEAGLGSSVLQLPGHWHFVSGQ
eukprot:scaffold476_cov111-Isochrysis_galbana.AAC.1